VFKLFTGSGNPKLGKQISKLINISLSPAEIIRFDNSEVRVTIQERVKNDTAVIIQPTSNPTDTNLMELFFFADALKRNGAKEIIAFIPYFGYARQNREHRQGEAVSMNVINRFLEVIEINKVFTINLHYDASERFFSIPFKNLSALSILGRKVTYYLKNNKSKEDVVIVSPDQGGLERARNFFNLFFSEVTGKQGRLNDYSRIAVIKKKRDLDHIHQSRALALYGDVKNKTCILVDDIITSGRTLINAADFCLKKGAKRVIACVVHHDFSPEAPPILSQSRIEKIFTSNTITLTAIQKFPQLCEISIASLIASEIKKLVYS